MRVLLFCGLLLLCLTPWAMATPTTEFWTPATIDIQPPKTTHLTLDNYFTVGCDNGESFPTDVGLTYGFKLSPAVNAEVGVDLLEPSDDPLFFNAKAGVAEGVLSKNAPGLAVGIFNVGTRSGVTNQNTIYAVAGKTLGNFGRLHVGGYWGNGDVLRSSAGKKANTGWMVGYDKVLVPNKWTLIADYASGDNALGGGGAGLSYCFNKDASLLFGPVWFNDAGINGKMKWSTQVDINF